MKMTKFPSLTEIKNKDKTKNKLETLGYHMEMLAKEMTLTLEDKDIKLPPLVEMNLADIVTDLEWLSRELSGKDS